MLSLRRHFRKTQYADSLYEQGNLEDCLPLSGEPGHGTAHRNDRHGFPGARGRGGTRGFGHRGCILYGDIHDGLRLQCRRANHHGAAQRRAELQGNRLHLLPRCLLPLGLRRCDVCPLEVDFAPAARAHHR